MENNNEEVAELKLEEKEQNTKADSPAVTSDGRYSRKDVKGGYIYGNSEINYYREVQKLDVVKNLLLGEYNNKGNYVVDKGIIEELIKMKKIYQYSFGSTMFCQSAYDVDRFGKIDFAIKIKNTTNGKLNMTTGYLQLLEPIDRVNGYYQNTNSAYIYSYAAPESGSFVVDCLKAFNVVSKKEDGFLSKEHQDENVDLIVARKNILLSNRPRVLSADEKLQKKLFEKRLDTLKKTALGRKMLEEFNARGQKINDLFLNKGKDGYYAALNQLLDGIIENHNEDLAKDPVTKVGLDKLAADHANSEKPLLDDVSSQTENANMKIKSDGPVMPSAKPDKGKTDNINNTGIGNSERIIDMNSSEWLIQEQDNKKVLGLQSKDEANTAKEPYLEEK